MKNTAERKLRWRWKSLGEWLYHNAGLAEWRTEGQRFGYKRDGIKPSSILGMGLPQYPGSVAGQEQSVGSVALVQVWGWITELNSWGHWPVTVSVVCRPQHGCHILLQNFHTFRELGGFTILFLVWAPESLFGAQIGAYPWKPVLYIKKKKSMMRTSRIQAPGTMDICGINFLVWGWILVCG